MNRPPEEQIDQSVLRILRDAGLTTVSEQAEARRTLRKAGFSSLQIAMDLDGLSPQEREAARMLREAGFTSLEIDEEMLEVLLALKMVGNTHA